MSLTIKEAVDMVDLARFAFHAGKPERPALWVMSKAAFDRLAAEAEATQPVMSHNTHGLPEPRLCGLDVYLDDAQHPPVLLDQAEARVYLDGRCRNHSSCVRLLRPIQPEPVRFRPKSP